MLDPNWTPEAGYSHADGLLDILRRKDAEREAVEDGDGELQEA